MRRNGSDSTRLFQKNDLILLAVFLLIAGAALAGTRLFMQTGSLVKVMVDGEEWGIFSLSEDREIVIEPEDSSWKNVLVIRDGEASMSEADCPDKICVHHKPITKTGETIVCLPHKVTAEIISESAGEKNEFDVIAQ